MIYLFTDFGLDGPYQGQVQAVLKQFAPEIEAITLMANAPVMDPMKSAYLLRAYFPFLFRTDVILAVIDPGVGTERRPLAIQLDGRWLVGPDNGLFELILRDAPDARVHEITWRPDTLSASFHGRDLFAPVAARLARGNPWGIEPCDASRFADWPDDLMEVIYLDHYGNAFTGLRAKEIGHETKFKIGTATLSHAQTFEAASGPFWYENSAGLVEIAARRQSAASLLDLAIGTTLERIA